MVDVRLRVQEVRHVFAGFVLQGGALLRQRFQGVLVGDVGGEPHLSAQLAVVVVQRQRESSRQRGASQFRREIVRVVQGGAADAHFDGKYAILGAGTARQRAEVAAGGDAHPVVDAVREEVGPLQLFQLQATHRALEFVAHGAQDDILVCFAGGLFDFVGAEWAGAQAKHRERNRRQTLHPSIQAGASSRRRQDRRTGLRLALLLHFDLREQDRWRSRGDRHGA